MKKTVLSIGILLLTVFFIDRTLGWYLDRLYEKNQFHYYNGHLNYFLQKERCDTLLLGSSRVLDNLDPEVFGSKTYNLAQAQRHLGWFAAVVDLLVQKGKMPRKVLIVNIEPEDFNVNGGYDLILDIHYLKYYHGYNAFITNEINQSSYFERCKFFSSLYRHNGEGMLLITNPWQGIGFLPEHKGFLPMQPGPQDSSRVMATIAFSQKAFEPDFNQTQAFRYFKHLKSLCSKHRVRLIVITAPYYRSSVYSRKASSRMAEFLTNLKVPYLNYVAKMPKELRDLSLWYDNKHLNAEGAQLFSERVLSDVRNCH
jgi:hypothetical protein